ncbi:peptidyl-prolyl cis-trans isomerase [Steroidobacter sp. S1-65]|uniref:Peptidyl-prolyl cis-trans isomerase n=1 Tax=Steroidobacter gossypii TaxID=2805490 RepID=A0ABS1WQP6_9GAMM|nr:peptidylprolyl isomerase [Steroidobacter gossypii]MBM0103299.1 peptidyl-prolyl cis-trans isomerase [Steroidobacter gossypii]
MSSVVSSIDEPAPRVAAKSERRVAWLREPLFHFVLIGAVLFGVDSLIAGQEENPLLIELDSSTDAEIQRVFSASRGREPNAEELQALRQVWLDNEVLYREGLALGLDKGDKAIRERVIFKALSMVDANTKRPPYDEQVLRAWFEKNRSRYDTPARFSFQEAVLSGDATEAAVRAFVSALNSGTPPDAEAGLRVFNDRPHSNIVQSYGAEFAAALEASPPGEWRAIQDKKGWRAMRLESTLAAQPADFEQLRGVVLQDWTDAEMAAQRSASVRALAQKYTIKIDGVEQK